MTGSALEKAHFLIESCRRRNTGRSDLPARDTEQRNTAAGRVETEGGRLPA
jgi:hypothetical protein